MLDFVSWCEDKSYELPNLQESGTRTGIRPGLPEGYLRSQYPDAYFGPTSATAYLDLKNARSSAFKDKPDVN